MNFDLWGLLCTFAQNDFVRNAFPSASAVAQHCHPEAHKIEGEILGAEMT